MRKFRISIVAVLMVLALVACANIQKNWQGATEDEKARTVLSGIQTSLNDAFDLGLVYVKAHPDKLIEWQTKVLPMFDATNKFLADLYIQGKASGGLTVNGVMNAVGNRVSDIQNLLITWGVTIKK